MPTIKEIAKASGVSVATVSNIITKRERSVKRPESGCKRLSQ